MIEIIPCADDARWHEARSNDITASVAGALLGIHEFETPYSLFHSKVAGGLVIEETAPMRRGRLLEPVAVQVLSEEYPDWRLDHNSGDGRRYYRDAQARLGATPDIIAFDPVRGPGIIQVKSVEISTFRRKWIQDGDAAPPVWIALQAMLECHLTGGQWAAVAPILVGHGVEVPVIDIPLDKSAAILAKLRAAVVDFWQRVERNEPPDPDFSRDGEVIAQIYGSPADDEIDLSDNTRVAEMLCARDALKAREADGAEAAKKRKELDAELIFALGNCSRARLADGRVLEAKVVNKKEFTVKASTYRSIRVKEPKQ